MAELSQLEPKRQEHAKKLHDESIVINGLDSTRIAQGDDAYIAKLRRSSITATNHTVASSSSTLDALKSIADWWAVYRRYPDDIIVGRSFDDIARAHSEGKTAVFLGFQDAYPVGDQIHLIDVFADLGIRFMQLTYQARNYVGDGSGEPGNAGLSQYGFDFVRELNRAGIVIDLSHVGVRTTLDAIEHSRVPVAITHSGARALCDTVRNKTDDEIKALAAKGGVIGIAAKSGFLKPDGLATGSTVDDYIDHIDYVAELVGIDHVGIGTDVGDERKYTKERMTAFHKRHPEIAIIDANLRTDLMHTEGLETPGSLGNITSGLVRRGYADADIKKILGENFMRVFREAWN